MALTLFVLYVFSVTPLSKPFIVCVPLRPTKADENLKRRTLLCSITSLFYYITVEEQT